MDPLVRYLRWGCPVAIAVGIFVNKVTVPSVVALLVIFILIAVPTTLAVRADSLRRGIPTRF